jgi:uncharacterized membrane protein
MFYQHNMGAGGWTFMVLGNILIWGLLIAFIIWLAQDLRTRPHRHHLTSSVSASEILDRRLASGEINPDQYQRLHTTLAKSATDEPRGPGSAAGAST